MKGILAATVYGINTVVCDAPTAVYDTPTTVYDTPTTVYDNYSVSAERTNEEEGVAWPDTCQIT